MWIDILNKGTLKCHLVIFAVFYKTDIECWIIKFKSKIGSLAVRKTYIINVFFL